MQLYKKILSIIMFGYTSFSMAEDNDIEKVESLDKVVVVGEYTDTVIYPEDLEKIQANDLKDIFRQIPSVSVGGSLGIAQKVYIRGLEDTLLNVTVDGAPQTGTLFHHIGRVSVDPELLKALQVQTGAGEATSGAGALGGAIRFITKDAHDLLSDDQNIGGQLKAGYFSNDGYRSSANIYGKLNHDWGMLASYVNVNRNNTQDGNGSELFGTAADQNLFFLKTTGRINEDHRLSVSYEKRQEQGNFGARPNWPVLQGETLFPMQAERQTSVANYQFNHNDWINLEATLYSTVSEVRQDRFDRWGRYGADLDTWGFDFRNTSQWKKHQIIYGFDYRNDKVASKYLSAPNVWQDWAWDPNIGEFREKGDVTGVYVQDHWQMSKNLLISFGFRYDEYEWQQQTYTQSHNSDGISTNIGFNYDINQHWQINLSYAEALRGKEVGDAFTLEQRPGRIVVAPDLQAEEVDNVELGLKYSINNIMLTTALYRSEIDNTILDQIGGGPAPQNSNYYENVGQLISKGFELTASYWWTNASLNLSYSDNDVELNGVKVEGYEHIGLGNIRGDTWVLQFNHILTDSLQWGVNLTHVEALNDIDVLHRAVELGWITQTQLVDKPDYSVSDIYLQWLPLNDDRLKVNFSILNIFDQQYRNHSSVADYNHIPDWEGIAGLFEPGRDIRVALTYRF